MGSPDSSPSPLPASNNILSLIHENDLSLREPVPADWSIPMPLEELVEKLLATMKYNRGVGLAAPQVGIRARVAVIHCESLSCVLVNPEVCRIGREWKEPLEGCLSLPGFRIQTRRHHLITVRTQWEGGRTFNVGGQAATALQHEIDHLDGKLITGDGPIVREMRS